MKRGNLGGGLSLGLAVVLLLLTRSGRVVAEPAKAAAWSTLSAQGESLYYGTTSFKIAPKVAGAPLPQDAAACLHCHGPLGEGSREAAIGAPDLRGGSDESRMNAMMRAVSEGLGTDGRPLGAAMPRYALGGEERAALRAFLPWLGQDNAPVRGVTSNELRLGLQLTGLASAAARGEVEAGLRGVLQQANERGGVHGRQIRLVDVADKPADVLALVASAIEPKLRERLARERLPNLASLALEVDDASPTGWTIPLLPSLRQQARSAVQLLASAATGCTQWILDPRGWLGADEMPNVRRIRERGDAAAQAVGIDGPSDDICLAALAPPAEVDRLRDGWAVEGVHLKTLVELAWLRPRPLSDATIAHHLILPTPSALASSSSAHGRSLWFLLGEAAGRAGIEALAGSGRALQPESLLAHFRALAGFEPVAGAPLVINRQQTHGWAPEAWHARQ